MKHILWSLFFVCCVVVFSSYQAVWAQSYFVKPKTEGNSDTSRSVAPRLYVTPDRMGRSSPVIIPRFKTQKNVMRPTSNKYQYNTKMTTDSRGLALIDRALKVDSKLMSGKRAPTSFAEINQMQLAATVPQVTGALKFKREGEQEAINDFMKVSVEVSGADQHFKSVAKKVGRAGVKKPVDFASEKEDEEEIKRGTRRPPRIFNTIN